jgi:predicted site-specific integrase-resolvase
VESNGVGGRRFSKAKSIAGRLGICPRTIFRWADAGMITRHKINARVVLFDDAEVPTDMGRTWMKINRGFVKIQYDE